MKHLICYILLLFTINLSASERCENVFNSNADSTKSSYVLVNDNWQLLLNHKLEINGNQISMTQSQKESGLAGSLYFHATPLNGEGPTLQIAQLNFKLSNSNTKVIILNIDVNPLFQKQGLGTLAFKVLLDMYPDVKTVVGFLAKSNEAEFKKYYSNFKKIGFSQEALYLALQKTPFYKSLVPLNFSNLDKKNCFFDPFESNSTEQIYISISR